MALKDKELEALRAHEVRIGSLLVHYFYSNSYLFFLVEGERATNARNERIRG